MRSASLTGWSRSCRKPVERGLLDLLREGALELYATQGLNPEAVHVTRLAVGEGLTGTIAENIETLNLAEAKAHPISPIVRNGRRKVPFLRRCRSSTANAVGVLCVQHVDPRRYEEVEIEALQTTAMVLSELITHKELVDDEAIDLEIAHVENDVLEGLALVKGLAAGRAVFHQPRIEIDVKMAEDIEAERQRVYRAFDKMRDQIIGPRTRIRRGRRACGSARDLQDVRL